MVGRDIGACRDRVARLMGWALLLALPLLAIALAALTARQTLLAALKKIL